MKELNDRQKKALIKLWEECLPQCFKDATQADLNNRRDKTLEEIDYCLRRLRRLLERAKEQKLL